jgi:hypothetical protein
MTTEEVSNDIQARIKELVALENGWLDGEGVQINNETAELVLQVLDQLKDIKKTTLGIFPTEEGGLRCQWVVGKHEVVWEANASTQFMSRRQIMQLASISIEVPTDELNIIECVHHLTNFLTGNVKSYDVS